jgi:hypothetical protein
MSGSGMLKRSPGVFLASLMILLSVLRGNAMGMCRDVVQFSGTLMIFVV